MRQENVPIGRRRRKGMGIEKGTKDPGLGLGLMQSSWVKNETMAVIATAMTAMVTAAVSQETVKRAVPVPVIQAILTKRRWRRKRAWTKAETVPPRAVECPAPHTHAHAQAHLHPHAYPDPHLYLQRHRPPHLQGHRHPHAHPDPHLYPGHRVEAALLLQRLLHLVRVGRITAQ
jgi:hypothetical protein